MSRRAYPPRRTTEERRTTHEAIYGKGAALPARQFRFAPTGNVSWPSWRKTEEERTATHQAIYGKDAALPERQYRYAPWGRYPNQSLTNTDWKPLAILGGILFFMWLVGRK